MFVILDDFATQRSAEEDNLPSDTKLLRKLFPENNFS